MCSVVAGRPRGVEFYMCHFKNQHIFSNHPFILYLNYIHNIKDHYGLKRYQNHFFPTSNAILITVCYV